MLSENGFFFPLCGCCRACFQKAATFNQSGESKCFFFFLSVSQRVLEADAAEDAFNDDDDYEVDTPKRRHRGKGRVSDVIESSFLYLSLRCTEMHYRPRFVLKWLRYTHLWCRSHWAVHVGRLSSSSVWMFVPQGRGSGRRKADVDDDKPYFCDSK